MTSKVEGIFKESIDKLNSMLLYLDTQLGTVSLSKEEIESIGVPSNHKPLVNMTQTGKDNKKEPKKEHKKEEHKKEHKKEEHKKEEHKKEEHKKEHKGEKKEEAKKEPKNKKKIDPKEYFELCDLKVGHILKCEILEGFNDVYSLLIDVGEKEPRIIGTGLRNHVPIPEIQDSKVIVFSNLKPKRFGTTFVSNGMIMCAGKHDEKDPKNEAFELIRPNKDAKPGERVYLEGTELNTGEIAQITGGKFSKAIEFFHTDENCNCTFNGMKMQTTSGVVTVPTFKNSVIS